MNLPYEFITKMEKLLGKIDLDFILELINTVMGILKRLISAGENKNLEPIE